MGKKTFQQEKIIMLLRRIEIETEKILDSMGIKNIPIPVEQIALKENIKIGRASSNDFSGLLVRETDYALIGVNSSEHPRRQRFTIAHELGHYFLHPNKDAFVDYRDNKKDIVRSPKEVEANKFAAALLMPKKFLERDSKAIAKEGFTESHLHLLAQQYDVSDDAMQYRLIDLNFLA